MPRSQGGPGDGPLDAPPARRRRRPLRILLVAAASLVGALLLLELGLRLQERWLLATTVPWAVYDPVLGYRTNPALPGHNALGLNDDPLGPRRGTRLLMLGDSVTYYGDGPADTYVGRLEALVRERDPAFEAIDAGVRGYTTHQELLWLERDGLPLEPDLVGVGFVLNDLYRFLHRFRVEDGRIVGHTYEFSDEAVASESALYRLLSRSRALVWIRRRLSFVRADALIASGEGYSFQHRPDFKNAWRDEPWEDARKELTRLAELGREHGFRAFLVVFPFGEQYRADYLARDRAFVLSPQRRLAAIAADLGLPLLDLYADLDPAADLEADGIHLTPAGRGEVAQLLAAFLRERGLLATGSGG